MKSVWPRSDDNGNNYLSFDEAKPFINEVVGPMIGRDVVDPRDSSESVASASKRDLFSEEEYRQIFAQIDIRRGGQIAKPEAAQYLSYLAKNRDVVHAKSQYLLKLN